MSIEFRCSRCNRLLRTGDGTAGLQAECPECGGLTTVPEASPEMIPPRGFGGPEPTWAPQYAARATLGDLDPVALARVSAPAQALMFMAGFVVALQALALVGDVLRMVLGVAREAPMHDWFPPVLMPPASIIVGLFGVAISVLVFWGAYRMKRLENYRLARTAAVVAMIPCVSPCCLVGLPLGLWALLVLEDRSVKAAFRS